MPVYPDLVSLQLHALKQRHPRKPAIYQAFDHPLHPTINPGRTFVVLMQTTMQSMEDLRNLEDHLLVPNGQKENLDEQGTCCNGIANDLAQPIAFIGLLQLVPGDYLFARDTRGSGDPEEDTVLVWVVGA
jgi:hypothetical protein